MKQDFFNAIFLFLLLVIAIVVVIIGCKLVVAGQQRNELYQQYLYTER